MTDKVNDEFGSSLNDKYEPNEFYVASRNKKGFGTTLRVMVPPDVLVHISELVQKQLVPAYRTREDFIRDALVHNLHRVRAIIKDDFFLSRNDEYLDVMMIESALYKIQVITDARANHERMLRGVIESARQLSMYEAKQVLPQAREILKMTNDPETRRLAQKLVDELTL